MKKTTLFFLVLAALTGQVDAQSSFAKAEDSIWFFRELPFPFVSLDINFSFNTEMLRLDSLYAGEPEKPKAALPSDAAGIAAYFNGHEKKDEAALELYRHFADRGNTEQAELYLKTAIELKTRLAMDQGDGAAMTSAAHLIETLYGREQGDERIKELVTLFSTRYPQKSEPWNYLTLFYSLRGDTAEARKCLDFSRAIDDRSVDFYLAIMQYESFANLFRLQALHETMPEGQSMGKKPIPALSEHELLRELQKKYPDSFYPELSLHLSKVLEWYGKLFMLLGDRMAPSADKKPVRIKLHPDNAKELKAMRKYFESLIANPQYKQTYIAQKALGMINVFLNDTKKAREHLGLAARCETARRDESLAKMHLLPLFLERNYKAAADSLLGWLGKRFSWQDAMLYARLRYETGDEAAADRYLENLLRAQIPPNSKPAMALVYLALKARNIDRAVGILQETLAQPEEVGLRDEDFYFYIGITMILTQEPEQARSVLQSVRDNGKEYDKIAERYLEYFWK